MDSDSGSEKGEKKYKQVRTIFEETNNRQCVQFPNHVIVCFQCYYDQQVETCNVKSPHSTFCAIRTRADCAVTRALHGFHIWDLVSYALFPSCLIRSTDLAFAVALTTMSSIFEDTYHQTTGIAGLNYLALGIGVTCFSQLNARYMDRIYIHLKQTRGGGVGEPEFRLRELCFILPDVLAMLKAT